MARRWTLYQASNPIDQTTTERCIELLNMTAKVHRERSLASVAPETIMNTINSVVNDFNWMKVHCGVNTGSGDVELIVLYHLLKHRQHAWSVSVGFDVSLLPAPDQTGDPNDPDNPYVDMATELSGVISAGLSMIQPARTKWYSIDDIGPNSDGSYSVQDRRRSRIGELGWIAENNDEVRNTWQFSSRREPRPINENGKFIRGLGRPNDTHVRVTEATKR